MFFYDRANSAEENCFASNKLLHAEITHHEHKQININSTYANEKKDFNLKTNYG